MAQYNGALDDTQPTLCGDALMRPLYKHPHAWSGTLNGGSSPRGKHEQTYDRAEVQARLTTLAALCDLASSQCFGAAPCDSDVRGIC
jgi:hypothetical protein